jgi:uncharacterized protein with HEPN domain
MLSKSEDPERWLIDIAQNIRLAQSFTADFSLETFSKNRLVFYGVTRCLEIISEASRHLPLDLKERHPSIPWTSVAGAGNFYRHEYGGVDRELVWGTVETQLPALLAVVVSELKRLGLDPPVEDD